MLTRCLHRQQHGLTRTRPEPRRRLLRRAASSNSQAQNVNTIAPPAARLALKRTRNIGIIAHIDAGKTTTTERMLYYSGYTRRIGNVDEGSTVTDFLPAERARGITIQSAAITFQWPPGQAQPASTTALPQDQPRSSTPHTINLIDTPGHADFTFEVLRSLRVLDGAVCILDSVAGVEAQTEKVWAQSAAYHIPRLVYVNKLDREGASFARTVRDVGTRLGVWPAVCGIPWWGNDGTLKGVGDVLGGRGLRYADGGDGREIVTFALDQLRDAGEVAYANELSKARDALIELLSEHDETIVEKYLEGGTEAITANDIIESLRRCVLQFPQRIAPVFAGASFRNIGVQPLLDAVVDLLPSPNERPDAEINFGGGAAQTKLEALMTGKVKLEALQDSSSTRSGKALSKDKATFAVQKLEVCALAFKVAADSRGGVLVYVRVYSGVLKRNSALWNTSLLQMERAQRLVRMYADDPMDIDTIEAGSIGVIPGLKLARTGDTLISYAGANPKTGPPSPLNSLHLRPIVVPPPVFFAAVEPNSLGEEKHIKDCLDLLLREDPSLSVRVDPESGQTHLAGMGELHLEIAGNRLLQDLKAKARIGEIQIGYREALTAGSPMLEGIWEHDAGGKSLKAGYSVHIVPRNASRASDNDKMVHVLELGDDNRLVLHTPKLDLSGEPLSEEVAPLPSYMPIEAILETLKNGSLAALASGPAHGFPVHSTDVHFSFDQEAHIFPSTTPQALSSMARTMVRKAVRESIVAGEIAIMEPVMLVTISVDEGSLGDVVHDISSARGGSIISLGSDDESNDNISADGREVDVARIYTPPDPYGGNDISSTVFNAGMPKMRQIVARVPLKEMVGYLKHLRSLTAGRGTFTMVVDQFETMGANRQKLLLQSMRGSDY